MTSRLFSIVSAPCFQAVYGALGTLIFLRLAFIHELTEIGRAKYRHEQLKKENPNRELAPIKSELNSRYSTSAYQQAEK